MYQPSDDYRDKRESIADHRRSSETGVGDVLSGVELRRALRASALTGGSRQSVSESCDDVISCTGCDVITPQQQYVDCYSVRLRAAGRRQPWIKHDSTDWGHSRSEQSGKNAETTWMATLTRAHQFHGVERHELPAASLRRLPLGSTLVYLVDEETSVQQPRTAAASTASAASVPGYSSVNRAAPAAGGELTRRSASLGTAEMKSAVNRRVVKLRSVDDQVLPSRQRDDRASAFAGRTLEQGESSGAGERSQTPPPPSSSPPPPPPPVPPKPDGLPSISQPPFIVRKLQAGAATPADATVMSVAPPPPRLPPKTTPPPLPARRQHVTSPPVSVRSRVDEPFAPLVTASTPPQAAAEDLASAETAAETSVAPTQHQIVSTTDSGVVNTDVHDADTDLENYNVDVCSSSLLDYVLQAGMSTAAVSSNADDANAAAAAAAAAAAGDDDADDHDRACQQSDDNTDIHHYEPVTPSAQLKPVNLLFNAECSQQISAADTEQQRQFSASQLNAEIPAPYRLHSFDSEDCVSLSFEVPAPDDTLSLSMGLDAAASRHRYSMIHAGKQQQQAVMELGREETEDMYEDIDEYREETDYLVPRCGYEGRSGHRRTSSARSRQQQQQQQRVVYRRARGAGASADVTIRRSADRRMLPRGSLLVVHPASPPDAELLAARRDPPTADLRLALDHEGSAFFLPASSLREFDDATAEPWFYPLPLTARQATVFLANERQLGCFVVYRPAASTAADRALYLLSVSLPDGQVVHYEIERNRRGDVMIAGDDRSFLCVRELVDYYRSNGGRLATRLRRALRDARLPVSELTRFNETRHEISRADLSLAGDTLHCPADVGQLYVGMYKNNVKVAVRVLDSPSQQQPDVDDDFFHEALVLRQLQQHDGIAQLIGVVSTTRPYYIVTQLAPLGCLRNHLRHAAAVAATERDTVAGGGVNDRPSPFTDRRRLLTVCRQAASAVAYLADRHYVLHRAVAACSFYVTAELDVQLGNFARARAVTDDEFIADEAERVWVKSAAPEVLRRLTYSTKSDVWALGVFFWELYSGASPPYERLHAEQTAAYVCGGGRLDRPVNCSVDVYQLMRRCWSPHAADRPTTKQLLDLLQSADTDNGVADVFASPQAVDTEVGWTANRLPLVADTSPEPAVTSVQSSVHHHQLQQLQQPAVDVALPQVPHRRHHKRHRLLRGGGTGSSASRHKWRLSLFGRSSPSAPASAPVQPLSPSAAASAATRPPLTAADASSTAAATSITGGGALQSTLSVPDDRRGRRRRRSNASTTRSTDDLSSRDSLTLTYDDEHSARLLNDSGSGGGRHSFRALLARITVNNNLLSSDKNSISHS